MEKIGMKMAKDITIKEGYEEFIRRCKVKNYSPYTIKYYNNTIHAFEMFCDLDTPVITINEDLINQFTLHLQDQNIKECKVASYMKGMRTIVYFFVEKDYIDEFKVSLPRSEKTLKEVYTDAELEILLKKPNIKKCSFGEYRSWVMTNYLIATGQRLKNLQYLKIKDLDFDNRIVRLNNTKNRKQTLLPLSNGIIDILKEYLRFRKGAEEDYVFCKIMVNHWVKPELNRLLYVITINVASVKLLFTFLGTPTQRNIC